jgi:hypothetical protein
MKKLEISKMEMLYGRQSADDFDPRVSCARGVLALFANFVPLFPTWQSDVQQGMRCYDYYMFGYGKL